MLRKLLIACLAAGFAVPGAAATERTLLMPNVTYDREVQFTPRGPVVVHVITTPRPGGLYDVHPELSNATVPGLEKLTAIERRAMAGATVAGVSGDEQPTGLYLRGGVIASRPLAGQSSIGFDPAGALHVDRVAYFATWAGSGIRHPGLVLNQAPGTNGVALFTPAWGPATPASTNTLEAVVPELPPVASNVDLGGVIGQVKPGGGTPIPPGGAVLVARGTAVPTFQAELPAGANVTLRVLLGSGWSQLVNGMGGGPLLVRDGRPILRAGEAFSTDQLALRSARCAVGQRADGSVLLVTVDGRQPGYSSGLTNYELAQTMARLQAVTAAGLSIGNAASMAFEGRLLSRPSAPGGERTVADALLVSYTGVQASPLAQRVVSPNGDGLGDSQVLDYKVVRPSKVTAQLIGPGGSVEVANGAPRAPGTYRLAFPGGDLPAPLSEGRYRWVVTAVDDGGRTSTAERDFAVNNTLGFVEAAPPALARAGRLAVRFRLARPAAVTVTVESSDGKTLRSLLAGSTRPGGVVSLSWDGRDRNGRALNPGRYRVRVLASNDVGRVAVTRSLRIRAG